MSLAERSIENRTVTLVLTVVTLLGGMYAYQNLSRLEDPEFTIKEALVVTRYPGATAAEVEEEVSDEIEKAVQQLGQLDEVESKSDRGLSTVTARIKKTVPKEALPQVWDELRRKVNDIQGQLPPGAGPSLVVDDFGDVWGVFFAIYGPEYSYAELKDYVDLLRRELLLVQDVAKVDTWGERVEAIYVEPSRDRMSQLGIPTSTIVNELRSKNIVADAGRVRVGPEFIAIEPTGVIRSVADFENILLTGEGADGQIHLKDVATVRRGYVEPQDAVLRYDGNVAIGLGISTVAGGNVVTMGEAITKRIAELADQTPLGIEIAPISVQSDAVTTAISGFIINLAEAVAIVVGVLLIFMGLRSGLIIGFVLVLTISGTFIFMGPWNVALERISLGALVIALGMLVDNAIVVVDGMLVRMQGGQDARSAAIDVTNQTSTPLLGATAVAIMAFASIGTSPDSTGEFCRSLFQVVFLSLGLSWVTAMTVTPLLGIMFLKPAGHGDAAADPYGGRFYGIYRGFLRACLRLRWVTTAVVLAFFAAALWGFRYVDNTFFPASTRPQFLVDFWLPQGTDIDRTVAAARKAEEQLRELDAVTHVTTFVGQGGMRFLLTYSPEKKNSAYAQFLVDVGDYREIDGLIDTVEEKLPANEPDAAVYATKFQLGPGGPGKIQVRLSGRDADVLRQLAARVQDIMHEDGGAKAVRTDWRQRVKVIRPQVAETEANLAGISREDIARAIKAGFEGERVGVYRDGDLLLPIIMRAPENERASVDNIRNLQIWSDAAGQMIPLRQVVSDFKTDFEDEMVMRLDRKRTVTVFCDPKSGTASKLLSRLMPRIEAIERPPGYELEWGGEYEDSGEAQQGLMATLPIFILAMILIVIALFNNLRQPAIIWLCVPLALIGVTVGLLAFRQPFGFMSLLGFLSLSGMLIKNAIVLIDEINAQQSPDKPLFDVIVDSATSRLRPVAMAALTTALGMLPLLTDAFFISMAVTIIFGLMFATVLTMVVVPTLYVIFYRAQATPDPSPAAYATPGGRT